MKAINVRILLVRNWWMLAPRGLIAVLLLIFAFRLRNLIEVRQDV